MKEMICEKCGDNFKCRDMEHYSLCEECELAFTMILAYHAIEIIKRARE